MLPRSAICLTLSFVLGTIPCLWALEAPRGYVARSGDRSVVLHWDQATGEPVSGYQVERASTADGPFSNSIALSPAENSWCDLQVTNGQDYFYRVRAVDSTGAPGPCTPIRKVRAKPFANDSEFLEYVQQTAFDYFWYTANPTNGLIPDRTMPGAASSIAAVGFGLTAIGIGIDHGWITRAEGAERVLKTLRTFHDGPQNNTVSNAMGYKGWFYHFLEPKTALRFTRFHTELSSIDTALVLAGAIYAEEYFDQNDPNEKQIRSLTKSLVSRVDWQWMADEALRLRMGWQPDSGFLKARWTGYNEAAILYILAIGARENALPPAAWDKWTSSFEWGTNYGFEYAPYPVLFVHQYSQCWLDLRSLKDSFMRARNLTYFENSRRATLAQHTYCKANPGGFKGYGSLVWGLTAGDGPTGYEARGAPPPVHDDGTIAPTAVGGSVPFAPEICLPALRHFYTEFRTNLWTPYGFSDGFNLHRNWWATDVLGIDQGPILIMIENHRTQRVWQTFMKSDHVRRGFRRAGFQ